jgi:hypothetical protein
MRSTNKQLRIGSATQNRAQGSIHVPQINLSGLWLENYGFESTHYVQVQAQKGKIIITAKPKPKHYYEKK